MRAVAVLSFVLATSAAAQDDFVETSPGVYEAPNVTAVSDVVYATRDSGELLMDVVFPANAEDLLPAVVFVHGGAWSRGERSEGHTLAYVLASGGYLAATIDYRLLPDATYPAAVLDTRDAVRFIQRNAEELGVDPERVAVVGATAGGHMALLVALAENDGVYGGGDDELVLPSVVCAAAVSGSTDLLDERFSDPAKDVIGTWLGAPLSDAADLARQASPITHVDADDPKVLLIHGRDDPIVPPGQARRLSRRIRAVDEKGVNVVLLDGEHHLEPEQFLRPLLRFIDSQLRGNAVEAYGKWQRRREQMRRDR